MGFPTRTPAEVGAAIRARRRELKWDQAELAEKAGVSRLWVNQIENGKPGASLGLVLKTFGALGLTLGVGWPDEGEQRHIPDVEAADISAILTAARNKTSR